MRLGSKSILAPHRLLRVWSSARRS